MKSSFTITALLVLLTAGSSLAQTTIFDGYYTVISGYGPNYLTAGDVNGDSNDDLIFASSGDYVVCVARANGNGTFAPVVHYPIGVNVYSITLALINTDPYLDLLVGSDNEDLRVYFNDGLGGFVFDTAYGLGSDASAIAWADFDHDLDNDVAVVVYNGIVVLYNDGAGRFAQIQPIPCGGNGNSDIAAVDQDQDTWVDIIMCGQGGDSLYTFHNNHPTGFDSPVQYSAGALAVRMVVSDFNADWLPDVALANRTEDVVSILIGQAGGTLASRVTYAVPGGPICVDSGDFNADGYPDLAVGCFDTEQLAIMRNNQDGTFTFERSFKNNLAYSIGTGRFDDDLNLDLVTVCDDYYCRIMFGDGACDFPQTNTHFTETGVYDFAVADIDFDNDSDLVFTNRADHRVDVIRGDGDGTFGSLEVTTVAGMAPADMILADVDNANGPDVIFADDSKDSLVVMLNNGSGAFPSVAFLPTGDRPLKPIAAYFNGDAFLDLAVPNADGYTVSVMLNNQDGTFGVQTQYPVPNEVGSVTALDLDGDLDQDMAIAVHGWPDYEIDFYLNDGAGAFTAGPTISTDLAPAYVSGVDIDNDNDDDLVVGVDGDSLYVYINDGAGNFGNAVIYDMPYYCYDPKFVDLDFDGDLDIVIHHGGYYYFTVVGNDGDGTFGPPLTWFYGDVLADVEVGDFDADGYPDIAAMPADYCYDSLLLVYINQGGQIPTGVYDNPPPSTLPNTFALAAWPNPFNPAQTISFSLPRRAHLNLDVINVLGQKVRTLIDTELPSGETRLVWDGRNDSRQLVASGVYFYHLSAGDQAQTLKVALVR